MKYLIYLRVSTDQQDTDTQLDHCLRFIKQKDKSDFKYLVFRDQISSRNALINRDGGKEMLSVLSSGDVIVSMRLDRLSRKLYETTQLIDILDKAGVEIMLVDQPGITNKIMLGLYAGMAEEELKLLKKRVREKLHSKKNRGERYSGLLPYGYGLHETRLIPIRDGEKVVMKRGVLVPIYEEQQAISQMLKYFEQGMSYQSIAQALDSQGYKNRQGNPFQKMSIYRILSRIVRTRSSDQPQEVRELQLLHS